MCRIKLADQGWRAGCCTRPMLIESPCAGVCVAALCIIAAEMQVIICKDFKCILKG